MKQGLNKETESEYQREYRHNNEKKKYHVFRRNYQDNLDFRVHQKGRFQRHIREPFQWDEEEWYDTDSDLSCDEMFLSMRRNTPLCKYKHEKLNRMYRENNGYSSPGRGRYSNDHRHRREVRSEDEGVGGSESDDGSVVHVFGGNGGAKDGGKRGRDIYLHYDDDDNPGSSRSADGNRRSRTASSRLGRSKSRADPGPFVPYGNGNNSKEVNIKKTHNVRASKDVHPSAVRAQTRLREQQHENADSRRRLHDVAGNEASRNSMSKNLSYNGEGVRSNVLSSAGRTASGRNRGASNEYGITTDGDGNPIPWQRGGSHAPYIPDGSGTAKWMSEYEREYRTPKTKLPRGARTMPSDYDWARRSVGASYAPNDPVGFGLSYGRRLRDQDIIPAI